MEAAGLKGQCVRFSGIQWEENTLQTRPFFYHAHDDVNGHVVTLDFSCPKKMYIEKIAIRVAE